MHAGHVMFITSLMRLSYVLEISFVIGNEMGIPEKEKKSSLVKIPDKMVFFSPMAEENSLLYLAEDETLYL